MSDSELPIRMLDDASTGASARRLLRAAADDKPVDDVVLRAAVGAFLASGSTAVGAGAAHAAAPAPAAQAAAAPKVGFFSTMTGLKALAVFIVVAAAVGAAAVVSRGAPGSSSAAAPATAVNAPPRPPAAVSAPEPRHTPVEVATTNVHDLPSAPDLSARARVAGPVAVEVVAATPASADPPTPDDFEEEMRQLRAARARLAAGDPQGALVLLDAHDRAFAKGQLVPEARAMRVDALLAAGRVDEARAHAERFVRDLPRSPQAARIRRIAEGTAR